mmetsp:Transcript_4313/g.14325  ORF Transcript_4313/g.14325 Transcript_4313/m.14325 type:complete len:2442 (+) Transcript_4313:87-7412(+)
MTRPVPNRDVLVRVAEADEQVAKGINSEVPSPEVEEEDSRDSWPSMTETLSATDFSADLYVRRQNKRFGWRKCVGLVSLDATTDAARLTIMTTGQSSGEHRHNPGAATLVSKWSVSSLRLDVSKKRAGLWMSQQSTTRGSPVHRLTLTIDPGDVFDIGFFGSEPVARQQRDSWIKELLLAGATAAVELTACVLAPVVGSAPSIAAMFSPTDSSQRLQRRVCAAFSALHRALSAPSPPLVLHSSSIGLSSQTSSCQPVGIDRDRSPAFPPHGPSSSSRQGEEQTDKDVEERVRRRAELRAMRRMARVAAAVAVTSHSCQCAELRRVAAAAAAAFAATTPTLAVTARVLPWLALADDGCIATVRTLCEARCVTAVTRAIRVSLLEDLGGAACRALAAKATSSATVDAARALASVGISLRSQDRVRLHGQCDGGRVAFPGEPLCAAISAVLADAPTSTASLCDAAALVAAVARTDLRRFRLTLSKCHDGLAARLVSALRNLKANLDSGTGDGATAKARLDLVTAICLAVEGPLRSNDNPYLKEETRPTTDDDSVLDGVETDSDDSDVMDELVYAKVCRLGLHRDSLTPDIDERFAGHNNHNLHGEVFGSDDLDGESWVGKTQQKAVAVYGKHFQFGGQSGLGLELTAGASRCGRVAPMVHRTNNATHRRGVAFQDELVEVNGRVIEYVVSRGVQPANVRAAMVAACDIIQDAPWPKRLVFVRRSAIEDKLRDIDAEWRSCLAAKPAAAGGRAGCSAGDSTDAIRVSCEKATLKALASPALINALFDDADDVRTRLLACRIAAVLAASADTSIAAFTTLVQQRKALLFAAKEIGRGGKLLKNTADRKEEAEDFVCALLGAYAALLAATNEWHRRCRCRVKPRHQRMRALAVAIAAASTRIDGVVDELYFGNSVSMLVMLEALYGALDDFLRRDNLTVSQDTKNDKDNEEGDGAAWWNDPQQVYHEVCCIIEEPPLGCTLALRGQDAPSFACRVEGVDSEGRADCGGVKVGDILVRVNDQLPPRNAASDVAFVDFFNQLDYPITLTFVRRVAVNACDGYGGDKAEDGGSDGCARCSEERVLLMEVETELAEFATLPRSHQAKRDVEMNSHDAALTLCASTLLYSSRKSVVTLAARALSAAARHADLLVRGAAHSCVMDVRTAMAVAMMPGVVEGLSSWTPSATDATCAGLSSDEAAALLPLAETQLSDAVSCADSSLRTVAVAAARVLGPVWCSPTASQERYCRDSSDRVRGSGLENVPGSALARLIDIATRPPTDEDILDDNAEDLRCAAIDALTSLCGVNCDGHNEMGSYGITGAWCSCNSCGLACAPTGHSGADLSGRAAAACVADPTSTRFMVQLLGGSLGARIAKAATRLVLAAASAHSTAATALIDAGVMTQLAWLLRVEPASTTFHRCDVACELHNYNRHQQRSLTDERRHPVRAPESGERDISVDDVVCRALALDTLSVLVNVYCRHDMPMRKINQSDAHSKLHQQVVFSLVGTLVSRCATIILAGVAMPGPYRRETPRACRPLVIAARGNDVMRRTLFGPGLTALAALTSATDSGLTVLAPLVASALCTVGLGVELNGCISSFEGIGPVVDHLSESAMAVSNVAGGVAALVDIVLRPYSHASLEFSLRQAACLILRRAALASSKARASFVTLVRKRESEHGELSKHGAFGSARLPAFAVKSEPANMLLACAACNHAGVSASMIRTATDMVAAYCVASDRAATIIASHVVASSSTQAEATLLFVAIARCRAGAAAALVSMVASVPKSIRDAAVACLAHVPLTFKSRADHWKVPTMRCALLRIGAAAQISPRCSRAIALLVMAKLLDFRGRVLKCTVARALASGDRGCRSAAWDVCVTTINEGVLLPLVTRLVRKHGPLVEDEKRKVSCVAASIDDVVGAVAPLAVLRVILETRPSARKDIEDTDLDALEELTEGALRASVLSIFAAVATGAGWLRVARRGRLRSAVIATLIESHNRHCVAFVSVAASRLAAAYIVDAGSCDIEVCSAVATALDVATRANASMTPTLCDTIIEISIKLEDRSQGGSIGLSPSVTGLSDVVVNCFLSGKLITARQVDWDTASAAAAALASLSLTATHFSPADFAAVARAASSVAADRVGVATVLLWALRRLVRCKPETTRTFSNGVVLPDGASLATRTAALALAAASSDTGGLITNHDNPVVLGENLVHVALDAVPDSRGGDCSVALTSLLRTTIPTLNSEHDEDNVQRPCLTLGLTINESGTSAQTTERAALELSDLTVQPTRLTVLPDTDEVNDLKRKPAGLALHELKLNSQLLASQHADIDVDSMLAAHASTEEQEPQVRTADMRHGGENKLLFSSSLIDNVSAPQCELSREPKRSKEEHELKGWMKPFQKVEAPVSQLPGKPLHPSPPAYNDVFQGSSVGQHLVDLPRSAASHPSPPTPMEEQRMAEPRANDIRLF